MAERGVVADLFAGEIVFASVFNCEGSAAYGAVVCFVMGSGARPAFPRASVQSLISLCFHQLDFVRKSSQSTERQQHTRQEEVFNRFLELVNKYAARERSITFYADRLFLTPRYLSTLVRQASGRTVMDWVNEAVMQEAKLMLRHTDKLVYQIADELNFPNASFFSKYFRRMAGMTPNDYRRKDE